MPEHPMKQMMQALASVPATEQRLRRSDFDLSNAAANQRSKIAEYEAEVPLFIREEPMRLMFTTVESFQTDGSGAEQTFNLSNDLLDTDNTTDLVLYENGERVQPDSIDYSGDSFTYTGPGTVEDVHAHYVFRDPVQITVEKHAPAGQGNVSEVVYDDATSVLHERNQNKEPPTPSFARSPLQGIVPQKWTVEVYAEGPVPVEFTEDTDGTEAANAILRMPVNRAQKNVKGLGRAVKQDIVNRV